MKLSIRLVVAAVLLSTCLVTSSARMSSAMTTWQVGYHCPDGTAVVGLTVVDANAVEGLQLLCRNVSDPMADTVAAGLPGTDSGEIALHLGHTTTCLGFRSYVTSLRYAVSSLKKPLAAGSDVNPISYVSLQCSNGELVTLDMHQTLHRAESLAVREAACPSSGPQEQAVNGWIVEYIPGSTEESNGARLRMLCGPLPSADEDHHMEDDFWPFDYDVLATEQQPAGDEPSATAAAAADALELPLHFFDEANSFGEPNLKDAEIVDSDVEPASDDDNEDIWWGATERHADDVNNPFGTPLAAAIELASDLQEASERRAAAMTLGSVASADTIAHHAGLGGLLNGEWYEDGSSGSSDPYHPASAAADSMQLDADAAINDELLAGWRTGKALVLDGGEVADDVALDAAELEALQRATGDYDSYWSLPDQAEEQSAAAAATAEEEQAAQSAAAAAAEAFLAGLAGREEAAVDERLVLYYNGDGEEGVASVVSSQSEPTADADDDSWWLRDDGQPTAADASSSAREQQERAHRSRGLPLPQAGNWADFDYDAWYEAYYNQELAAVEQKEDEVEERERMAASGFEYTDPLPYAVECGANCAECDAVTGECFFCRSGFSHDSIRVGCVACGVPNCVDCGLVADPFTQCNRCEAPLVVDEATGACVQAIQFDFEEEEEEEVAIEQQQQQPCQHPCVACNQRLPHVCETCAEGFTLVGNQCVTFNTTGLWQRHFFGFDGRKIDVVGFEAGRHYNLLSQAEHQLNVQFDGLVDEVQGRHEALALTRAVGFAYGPHRVRMELEIADDGELWMLVDIDGKALTSQEAVRSDYQPNVTHIVPGPYSMTARAYSMGHGSEAAAVQTPLLGLTVTRSGRDLELHLVLRHRDATASGMHGVVGRSAQYVGYNPGVFGRVSYVPAADYQVSGLFEADFRGNLFEGEAGASSGSVFGAAVSGVGTRTSDWDLLDL